MRLSLFAFVSLCLSSFAVAEEAVLAPPSDVFDQLDAAAVAAKAHAEARYAFTVDIHSLEDGKERHLKIRFDPRLEEGAQWRVLGQPPDALDKDTRNALKALESGEPGDDRLIYDKLLDSTAEIELAEETNDYALFTASLADDADTPKKVREALELTFRLEKQGGYISSVEMRSIKPFKPAAIAKIDSLVQAQSYAAPEEPGGPALMTESVNETEGRAMMKRFKSVMRQEFSDFERIDPSDMPVTSEGG